MKNISVALLLFFLQTQHQVHAQQDFQDRNDSKKAIREFDGISGFSCIFSKINTRADRVRVRLVGADKAIGMAWVVYSASGEENRFAEAFQSETFLASETNIEWLPFRRTFVLPLGNGEGDRLVWVGLEGESGATYWSMSRLKIDRTPPSAQLSNPLSQTVFSPILQFKGFSDEPIAKVTYDLINSNGEILNQTGTLTRKEYDFEKSRFSKFHFQCFDIELSRGENILVLHLVDRTGNSSSTEYTYFYDPTADVDPPEIDILWPPELSNISGQNITVRGQVDESTKTVKISSQSGPDVVGVIDRTGKFFIQNVPVSRTGQQQFVITAEDHAGNLRTKNLTFTNSGLEVNVQQYIKETSQGAWTTTFSDDGVESSSLRVIVRNTRFPEQSVFLVAKSGSMELRQNQVEDFGKLQVYPLTLRKVRLSRLSQIPPTARAGYVDYRMWRHRLPDSPQLLN
ncbi:MAG TPA: hypothetical protein EYQ50_23630 [Verrucomicrobiales bacterium]|nr:hypothetical protein [Verrucomicrobiales bacterium]